MATPDTEQITLTKLANPDTEQLTLKTGQEGTFKDQYQAMISRIKAGDMGALPAIVATLLLLGLFSAASPYFLTVLNVANLFVQSATLITFTAALVFMLVLAEIDLSVGVAAGTSMAIFVKLNQGSPDTWILNLLLAFGVGILIGLFIGFMTAKVGVPSFIVTLALFLGLPGVMLIILGDGGVLRLEVPAISAIMNNNLPDWAGWAILLVSLGLTAGMNFWDRSRRTSRGLPNRALSFLWVKLGVIAVLGGAAVTLLNINRSKTPGLVIAGVPIVVPIVLVLLFVFTFVLDRTKYGRYIYAIGANPEAARRAGIKVAKIRIWAFVTCSFLGTIAGLFNVSRIGNVESSAGSKFGLYAVAAAVVGGVSLFGGRGRLSHAVLGALVISIIDNGLGLLSVPAGVAFLITGGVLVAAATVDALARKRAGGNLTRS